MTVCTEVLQMFILDFKMSKIKPQNRLPGTHMSNMKLHIICHSAALFVINFPKLGHTPSN